MRNETESIRAKDRPQRLEVPGASLISILLIRQCEKSGTQAHHIPCPYRNEGVGVNSDDRNMRELLVY